MHDRVGPDRTLAAHRGVDGQAKREVVTRLQNRSAATSRPVRTAIPRRSGASAGGGERAASSGRSPAARARLAAPPGPWSAAPAVWALRRSEATRTTRAIAATPSAVSSGQPVNQPHTARAHPPARRPAARSVTGAGRSAVQARTRRPPRPPRLRSHPTLRTTTTSACGGRAPARREPGRRRARRRDVRGAPRRRDWHAAARARRA